MIKSLLNCLFTILLFSMTFRSFSQVTYDNGPIVESNPNGFIISGTSWDCPIVTYFFLNGTPDISGSLERNGVRSAMDIWEQVTFIQFQEVSIESDADIRIRWASGDHGDSTPNGNFDGIGGVLAHAFFPPPTFGDLAGDLHFDEAETWTLNQRSSAAQPLDLITIAAHELGHSLGLDHTSVSGSLMNAFYNGSHRFLGTDDIAGVQSLYGQPVTIAGSTLVCTSGSTYSLQNLPSGVSVTWSRSSNLTYVSGQGTSSYTVKASSSGSGSAGWIRATLGVACGNIVLDQYDIWVGKPLNVTGTLSGPSTVYKGNLYTYNVTDQNHSSGPFHWIRPRGFTITAGGDGYNYIQVAVGSRAISGYIQVWRTNSCGNGGARYKYVTVSSGGGGPIETIISPNPATDEVSIELANTEELQTYLDKLKVQNEPFQIEIFDIYEGSTVHRGVINKDGLMLNLQNIKSGIYIVRVFNREFSNDMKLIVE